MKRCLIAALFALAAAPALAQDAYPSRKVVDEPDFKKAMAKVNSPIQYMDAPDFAKYWEADGKRLAALVKVVGKVEEQK